MFKILSTIITWGALGDAFQTKEHRPLLLIDEIDKADIDFPNDLLAELEDLSFLITETQKEQVARHTPITIITSNSENELPEAFLRRCIFYYVNLPDKQQLRKILKLHFPKEKRQAIITQAIEKFVIFAA